MNFTVFNVFRQILNSLKTSILRKNTNVLSRYSSSSSAPSPATSEKQLEKILQRNFPTATQISVNDVSGGCGAMYEIYIENPDFKGLSVVKQHRSVYDALKEQIKYIHALNLVTKVPS